VREGLFIKKNIDKWRQYQYERTADPDEMAARFTELVNDLGYSKTFYPHSKVTTYLNGLASKIYLGIYKNKKENYQVLENGASRGGSPSSQRSIIRLSDFYFVLHYGGFFCLS